MALIKRRGATRRCGAPPPNWVPNSFLPVGPYSAPKLRQNSQCHCPLPRPSCLALASGAQRSRPAGRGEPEERSTQLGLYPGCLGPGAGRRGLEGRRPASPAGSQLPRLARRGASSPPPPARQPARSPAHSGTPPGLDTRAH